MLKTILIHIWVFFITMLFSYTAILASVWDGSGNTSHRATRIWSRLILLASGVTIHVKGGEHLLNHRSLIFMANHQSYFDIPVLLAGVDAQFRWLAKAELFTIPVFGYAMKRAGCVGIDRSNKEKAFQSFKKAAGIIKNGTSILIFPEGTRSKTGEILPFKKGGLMLSTTANIPIVPIVISGADRIMKKGGINITPGKVFVDILDPVDPAHFTGKNRNKLVTHIRTQMINIHNKRNGELDLC